MRVLFLLVLMAMVFPVLAQEDEEGIVSFIRESRTGATSSTVRPDQVLPRQTEDIDEEEQTARRPDPETIIVAIVNAHVLTRAELSRKVSARMSNTNIEDTSATFGNQGFVFVVGGAKRSITQEAQSQLRQDRDLEYRDMLIRMEGEIVQEWIEYKILSDEARRQGLIISEREFQARLDEITRQYQLDDHSVTETLRLFGMSRADLEAEIGDALLIDKLLERYAEVNKPDSFLRTQYERNPDRFVTPPSFRIAHFSISIPELSLLSGNRRDREAFFKREESVMSTVRSRLRSGHDAQTIFDAFNEPENGRWGTVLDTNLAAGSMPENLRRAIMGLAEGQTTPVLQVSVRYGDQIVPETYHVVRLEKIHEPQGTTFQSALPQLRKLAKEASREELLGILMARGSTHRRMTNLGGINPERLPERAELLRPQPGIDLRMGSATAAVTGTRPRR